MKIEQTRWTQGNGWEPTAPGRLSTAAQLVLLLGSTVVLKEQQHLDEIKQAYPTAHLLGCSTSGEIYETQVIDDSLVVTAPTPSFPEPWTPPRPVPVKMFGCTSKLSARSWHGLAASGQDPLMRPGSVRP
jgi:hypothetical protein